MGIEVIIAVAVLSAGFVISVSLFGYWYWNFRKWLDQKLVSVLKEKMLSELTDEGAIVAAHQNALFFWLYIAWWCARKTEPTYTQLFSYRLANNKTLAEFLAEEANNPENSDLTQQVCVQNLVLLWHTQKLKANKTVSLKEKLTWFQRFVKWLFTDSTPASRVVFDTSGFTEQTALKPLQDSMSKVAKNLIYKNKPTSSLSVLEGDKLPEKYTPEEQLAPNPLSALLHKSLDIDFSTQEIPPDKLIPEQEFVTTVKLNLILDLDQVQKYGQEQIVALNQTVDCIVTYTSESQYLYDTSSCEEITNYMSKVSKRGNDTQTFRWLNGLKEAVSREAASKNFTVYLSKNAENMLDKLGEGFYMDTYKDKLDLEENLPLGFFIEEGVGVGDQSQTTSEFYVKFSPALYRKQKLQPKLASLQLDPYASEGQQFNVKSMVKSSKSLTKKHGVSQLYEVVFALLQSRNVVLSEEQSNAIKELDHKTALPAIIKIIPGLNTNGILPFLSVLIALKEKEGCFSSIEKPFNFFVANYLVELPNGDYFNSPEVMQHLNRLAKNQDEQLFILFYSISETTTSKHNRANFLQVIRRTFYLYDYFKERNIDLKKITNKDGFRILCNYPMTALDCLTKIEKRHPLLFPWMGEHLNDLPYPVYNGKKVLQAGYSFIHRAMYLDDFCWSYYETRELLSDLEVTDPKDILYVSENTLCSLEKPKNFRSYTDEKCHPPRKINLFYNCKRALFLRYLAYQVQDASILNALKIWEQEMGNLNEIQEEFTFESWNKMVNMVLNLPKKIDRPQPMAEKNVKKTIAKSSLTNFLQYSDQDIKKLLDELGAQDNSLKDHLFYIQRLLEKMNETAYDYYVMPGSLLEAQALFRHMLSVDREKYPDKYQSILHRVSKACYKLSIDRELFIDENLMPELSSIIQKLRECEEKIENKEGFEGNKNYVVRFVEGCIAEIQLKKTEEKENVDPLAGDISLIRQMYYWLTYNTSLETPKEGKWLRLEQVVAIILGYTKQISQEIETAEGKTLIIGCAALLHVLSGKHVNVLTHNRLATESGATEFCKLAQYFGVEVAFQSKPFQTVSNDINILYVDIGTRALAELCSKLANDSRMQSYDIALTVSTGRTDRHAEVALIDEVDNVVIDTQADTTMQISKGASEEADQALLDQLALFKDWIEQEAESKWLFDHALSEEKISKALSEFLEAYEGKDINQGYWKENFYFWLKAARLAETLKINEDYVIHTSTEDAQRRAIYLVRKTTTGCVDKISKWGEGVHTYVSFCERIKQGDPSIVVPGLSEVIAENDVIGHLATYLFRASFSGTLGQKASMEKIKEIVQSDHVVKFPRAKRQETEDFAWPLVPASVDPAGKIITQPKYSRAYHFPTLICENEKTQLEKILQAVRNLQAQDGSCLILWNTIAECEQFANYLRQNGVENQFIQIFDDAKDSEASEEDFARPSPDTIVSRAKEERMITIGTAIAGRGIDFKEVSFVIIAKPGLDRVIKQEKGRGGRDFDLANIQEMYNKSDFLRFNKDFEELRKATEPTQKENSKEIKTSPSIHSFFSEVARKHEQRLEETILEKLNNQRSLF